MFKRVIDDFDLKNTFFNGQCFRFEERGDGFVGVVAGKVIYLEQRGREFTVDGVSEAEFDEFFWDYFDLGRDYRKISDGFEQEENLKRAIEYGRGMRILRQDKWEALVSFIISQNNNITRIRAIIKRLSEWFGTAIEYNGEVFYSFPTREQFKDATEDDFFKLGCGYRSKYLAGLYNATEGLDLERLAEIGYEEAKAELLKIQGIGPKVADCILLFGLNYFDAFPVDTWIKKVMEVFFLKKSASVNEIYNYSRKAFGEYAGLAQQYLFYYARENKLKGID